jgi:hypothetical protein
VRPPGSRSPGWLLAKQVEANESRETPPPSPHPSPARGRAREFTWHIATILEGPLRRLGPGLPSLPAPDPELASVRVVWRRSDPSRTFRCVLGLRMESAESSSTWRDGRTRTRRSEPSPPRQGEVIGHSPQRRSRTQCRSRQRPSLAPPAPPTRASSLTPLSRNRQLEKVSSSSSVGPPPYTGWSAPDKRILRRLRTPPGTWANGGPKEGCAAIVSS